MIVARLFQPQFVADGLKQVRRILEVGADVEEHSIDPRVDTAPGQVRDAAIGVGGCAAGAERDAKSRRRLPRGDVEDMSREGRQPAHRPTRSSGLTGALRNSRPVACRSAATTAAGTTTVDGSPTPLAP